MTLKQDIEALQNAALSVEHGLRQGGYYSRDCDRVSDAVRRGMKSGFAFLIGEDGEPEIIPLGKGAGEVEVAKGKEPGRFNVTYGEAWHNPGREEGKKRQTEEMVGETSEAPYRQMAEGEEFNKATLRSHAPGEKTAGRFEPQKHEGARTLARKPTADTARRAQMTADAKAFTASQFERNRRIAEAQKARSREIHR